MYWTYLAVALVVVMILIGWAVCTFFCGTMDALGATDADDPQTQPKSARNISVFAGRVTVVLTSMAKFSAYGLVAVIIALAVLSELRWLFWFLADPSMLRWLH